MNPLAPPARGRSLRRHGRSWQAALLALVTAAVLGACASEPPGPIIDYPARHHLMLSLVLDRPQRLEAELQSTRQSRQSYDLAAWQRARERQAAYRRYQQSMQRAGQAEFQRLLALQKRAQAKRQQGQQERWSRFLARKSRVERQTVVTANPGPRWARFSQHAEDMQRAQEARERRRREAWAAYNKRANEAALAAFERDRQRRARWAAAKQGAAARGEINPERQQEREQRWAHFSQLQAPQSAAGSASTTAARP